VQRRSFKKKSSIEKNEQKIATKESEAKNCQKKKK